MLKLLGSLCILGGGVMASYYHFASHRRNRDTLSDLLSALRRMAEAVRMARTPLPALLDTLAVNCTSDAAAFFAGAADAARHGEVLPDIWRNLAQSLPLDKGDMAAVVSLGSSLQGDEETVCKAVSAVAYQLAKSVEETERKRPEEEKRATALWFSAAALLVILLI